jgi:hypothetical protein
MLDQLLFAYRIIDAVQKLLQPCRVDGHGIPPRVGARVAVGRTLTTGHDVVTGRHCGPDATRSADPPYRH